MAKVKTNFKELAAAISVPVSGPGSLTAIGQFITKRIQGYTRLGYSLAGNPSDPKSNKLMPLNPRYVARRKWWPSGKANPPEGGVGIAFSAGRSQLTASGQMLESISYVVNPSTKTVRVMVTNKTRRDGESNTAIARKNIDAGRPFIGLDKVGLETIKNRWINAIIRRNRR
jgi:hypothetical protein